MLWNETRRVLSHGGAWCDLTDGFITDDRALMAGLVNALPLVQEPVTVFGKTWPTPRLTSWHGDPGCVSYYSGRTFSPQPWTPRLSAIRDALEARTGTRFNAVLANYYRDGRDAMGAHADDEPELGPHAPHDVLIASVSLGAMRRFILKPKPTGRAAAQPKVALELGHGSLLVMGGSTQRDWLHHVPRTKRHVGPRLNLTFRRVRPDARPTSKPLRS